MAGRSNLFGSTVPAGGAIPIAAPSGRIDPLWLSVSGVLDQLTTAVGTIPVRGASVWTGLQPGTSGYVLTSNGAGAVPTWQATAAVISGLTTNGAVYAASSTTIASTAALTDGQLLIGKTGLAPVAATLTAGSGVTITNGAGTITIASTGGGSVAGLTTQVQYNLTGAFAASADFTYASSALTLNNALAANTSGDGLILLNNVAATAANQSFSPRLRWTGRGWKTNATAGSQTVDFVGELITTQGAANPGGYLRFSSQINSGGYQPMFGCFNDSVNAVRGINVIGTPAIAGNVGYGFSIDGVDTDTAATINCVRMTAGFAADIVFSQYNGTTFAERFRMSNDDKFYLRGTTGPYITTNASGNMSLVAQGTNQDINITPSGTGLGIIGTTASGSGIKVHAVTAVTNTLVTMSDFQLTSTGDMADGFGPNFRFIIRDNANVDNPIATLAALRNGADNSGDFLIRTFNAGSASEVARFDKGKNFSVGTAALATNATNGFGYMPTCPGTPTGVPTTKTGLAPFVFDSTANKIWVYLNSAWKGVAVT